MTHAEKTGMVRRSARPATLILALFLTLTACGGGGETGSGGKEDTGGKDKAETGGGENTQGENTQQTASNAQSYVLPGDEVYPEGVALNEATGEFFVGSTTDGTIFRDNIAEPGAEAEVLHKPNVEGRSPAVGMKVIPGGRIDPDDQLLIAGGDTGRVFVYNTTNGNLIRRLDTPSSEMAFINDVAVARRDAYFTDSMRPVLFKLPDVPDGGVGELGAWLDLEGTPIVYEEGFNLNGIAVTEDGRYLVTVQSNTGNLYRIDIESKEVVQIDLGGETLTGGDGILLDGQILYVVRGGEGVIVPVQLSEDFASGEVGEAFADPSFARPTTIAKYDNRLLVVNSQFDRRESGAGPELPFTVSDIEIP